MTALVLACCMRSCVMRACAVRSTAQIVGVGRLRRQEKGQEAAIVNAVSAIDTCFREPVGKLQCTKIQEPFEGDDVKPKGIFGF